MSMVEVAYELMDATVLVAGEPLLRAWGWPYDTILADLNDHPTMSPEELGQMIVDKYGYWWNELFGDCALSSIDLTKVSPLAAKIDEFAHVALASATPADWTQLRAARNAARGYARAGEPGTVFYDDYRDLGQFMSAVAASTATSSIRDATQLVCDALSDAVDANYAGSEVTGEGLSIYLPGLDQEIISSYGANDLAFVTDTHWPEFLNGLSDIEPDLYGYEFRNQTPLAQWGKPIEVVGWTRNSGPGFARESVQKFYLSRDNVWSSDDCYLGRWWTRVMGGNDYVPFGGEAGKMTLLLPSAPPSPEYPAEGTYYLIVKTDANDSVKESCETNNEPDPDDPSASFQKDWDVIQIIDGGTDDKPEITVLGNGLSIADGDTTPTPVDYTDFGGVMQGNLPIPRTFTVRNDGGGTLTLGAVTVPAGFTLTEGLSSSLAPGTSDTFTVQLDTEVVGEKTGDISFTNNDADRGDGIENPFNFRIFGYVAPGEAEITVLGNGVSIADGDTTPSLDDHTDFGSVDIAGCSVARTFTIYNLGTGGLTLTDDPIVSLTGSADFTVVTQPGASVLAGDSTTFQIRFDPSGEGLKTAHVSIANTDGDENPYDFVIQGTGVGDAEETLADDFEDDSINGELWVVGGQKRGPGIGWDNSVSQWEISHVETAYHEGDPDGFLQMRVYGPTSGNTYGADAWIRTAYDFNDGKSHLINFVWEPEYVDNHFNSYYIQVTDGYTSPDHGLHWNDADVRPETANLLWMADSGGNPVRGWFLGNTVSTDPPGPIPAPGPGKFNWSIQIDPSGVARLWEGPDGGGRLRREETLALGSPWYIRFVVCDGTSGGFPAGDAQLNHSGSFPAACRVEAVSRLFRYLAACCEVVHSVLVFRSFDERAAECAKLHLASGRYVRC